MKTCWGVGGGGDTGAGVWGGVKGAGGGVEGAASCIKGAEFSGTKGGGGVGGVVVGEGGAAPSPGCLQPY